MTSRDFCYWLQGFFEIAEQKNSSPSLDTNQTELVRRHLAMVFKHEIDPSAGSAAHQQELNAIHVGEKPIGSTANPQPQFGGTGPNGETLRC